MINKVLIIGGTHGNEWTGITIVKHYTETLKNEFPELDLHFIFANPEAHQLNKRFKDEDLNRAFQFLNESRENSFEHQRAKEIKSQIASAPCFIIDLHTTTSNMGSTLIVTQYNKFNLGIAAKVSQENPRTRVIGSPDTQKKYLVSQSDYGLMIEVGPIANSIIHGQILEETLSTLKGILKSLTLKEHERPSSIEIYEEVEDIYYPQTENEQSNAYLHPQFQDKDFTPLIGKVFPFKNFKNEEIGLTLEEERYPIFINEAAYYPQKLAFTLCRKLRKEF
ncbi:MAG: aspartoacylase [Bacteriovoracaceae bacterium]